MKNNNVIFMKPIEYTPLIITNDIEDLLKIESDGSIFYRGNKIAIDMEIVEILKRAYGSIPN